MAPVNNATSTTAATTTSTNTGKLNTKMNILKRLGITVTRTTTKGVNAPTTTTCTGSAAYGLFSNKTSGTCTPPTSVSGSTYSDKASTVKARAETPKALKKRCENKVDEMMKEFDCRKLLKRPETYGDLKADLTEALAHPILSSDLEVLDIVATGGTAFVCAAIPQNNDADAAASPWESEDLVALKFTSKRSKHSWAEIEIMEDLKKRTQAEFLAVMNASFETEGYHVMVSPYMHLDLSVLMTTKTDMWFNEINFKVTPPVCREIFKGIAKGLGELHKAGYAHGDLKPENVLLSLTHVPTPVGPTPKLIPRVSDFGHARFSEEATGPKWWYYGTCFTAAPEFWGTYTKDLENPKRTRLTKVANPTHHDLFPADVWAFGCMLRDIFGLERFEAPEKAKNRKVKKGCFWYNEEFRKFATEIMAKYKMDICTSRKIAEVYDHKRARVCMDFMGEELDELLKGCLYMNPAKRVTVQQVLESTFLKE
ncbi:Serine/threonine protein kinase [Saitoella coloradoensis]